MAANDPIVYVVHCVDTEGPLDESLDATFERIGEVFGIRLEPSQATLDALQRGAIDLGEKTEPVKRMLSPRLLNFNRTWNDIDRMLDRITAPDFRNTLPDSYGNGWVYSWFCIDHVGYTVNPRRRDLGHHRIFAHYGERRGRAENAPDRVFFHYHPLPCNRMAHSCATCYVNSNHIWEILARKTIERRWFPSVFRPGFHVTRPDSNWLLEQWIPFDYANQATDTDVDQPDLGSGRFGDWRRAPRLWGAYHPSHDDYQTPGGCRRWIFRCLNMEARLRELTLHDVHSAFAQAEASGSAVLAFTNHDFRDMSGEVKKIQGFIREAAAGRPHVRFAYTDALSAARRYLRIEDIPPLGLQASVRKGDGHSLILKVSAENRLFGPQPFLAVQDVDGGFHYDNFDQTLEPSGWWYTFDWQTFAPDRVAAVGIAGTGAEGQVEVVYINPREDTMDKTLINYDRWKPP